MNHKKSAEVLLLWLLLFGWPFLYNCINLFRSLSLSFSSLLPLSVWCFSLLVV